MMRGAHPLMMAGKKIDPTFFATDFRRETVGTIYSNPDAPIGFVRDFGAINEGFGRIDIEVVSSAVSPSGKAIKSIDGSDTALIVPTSLEESDNWEALYLASLFISSGTVQPSTYTNATLGLFDLSPSFAGRWVTWQRQSNWAFAVQGKNAGSNPTNINSVSGQTISNGGAYWTRMQTTGNTVRARYWAFGSSEPTTWRVSGTMSGKVSGHVIQTIGLGDSVLHYFAASHNQGIPIP